MLQQTTVKAVLPYFSKWIKRFPTVQKVAHARQATLLKQWQGLGYYQRARNIHKASKMIVQDHQGQIPRDFETLRRIPGFGPYTTGAVLSIAFDQRHPIIDGNVRRVVMRLLAIRGRADASHDAAITRFLENVMPDKDIRIFNQALMELGALVCRKHSPLCLACPLREGCRAYQKGIQEIIPEPRRSVLLDVNAVVAVISKEGRFLIQKRPPGKLFGDLWEFPGGKVKNKEASLAAVKREVKEELGVSVRRAKSLWTIRHTYTRFRVKLSVWRCVLSRMPKSDSRRRWVMPGKLKNYPVASGTARIIDLLMKEVL